MKKSVVYLLIFMLSLSLGLSFEPKSFSQNQTIKVVDYSYYVDQSGALNVVGAIQNQDPGSVEQVILNGVVFSSDGQDQAESIAQPLLKYLVPQQIAPFIMVFRSPNSSPDGTWYSLINARQISNITFSIAQVNATTNYQYPDLEITNSSSTVDSNGAFLVNGIIKNTGNQTATNLNVVGEFYDSAGTLVGIGYTLYLAPATLAPASTVQFQISALDLNQSQVSSNQIITSYSLQVQTEQPILQGNPPSVVIYHESATQLTPAPTAFPTLAHPITPGSATNRSNSSNLIIAGVAVVVIIVIIIAVGALMLNRRKPHQTVKQQKKARRINE